ncbi:transcriptional regulator [Nakamurella endophytica]|uniref:Transcriptional regulator n=1 Tax=Nakamurella endophytica TaxID=1748367 RepID=A0A917T938_9ACTN|nr:transcriptional regulator [Nakamurella endophytica]
MPEAWEVLGDPSRRLIFAKLAERPRAVVELAGELPISRPAVSQHLRVLKSAGVVTDEVRGTRRIYRLEPAAVLAFKDQLDAFWHRALAGFGDVVTPDPLEGSPGEDQP